MRQASLLGAVLMVTGTCIGAAMLALPVVASPLGVWGAVLLLFCAWLFMLYTGWLTVEANAHMPPESNFVSMASQLLNPWWGRVTTWVYAMLLYALIAAYFNGLVNLLVDAVGPQHAWAQHRACLTTAVALGVASVVALGTWCVDRLNQVLVMVLVAAYLALLLWSLPHLHGSVMQGMHWSSFVLAAPVVVTSFGFHVLVPNLRAYFEAKFTDHAPTVDLTTTLKRVVCWGSALPLLIYVVWTVVLFLVLPTQGARSLGGILKTGSPEVGVVHGLMAITQAPYLHFSAGVFMCVAVLSSLLALALSMVHFLKDGLHYAWCLTGRGTSLAVFVLAFLPPWLFAVYYPDGFILALEWAGVFVAFLHGILPAAMVYRVRRQSQANSQGVGKAIWPLGFVVGVSFVLIVGQLVLLFQ